MEYENIIIDKIICNFDFSYMVSVNVLTYLIIKIHDYFNGRKKVPIVIKRLYLFISILVLGIIYYFIGNIDTIVIINSSILAPVFWSWILSPIIDKVGIGYKKDKK